MVKEITQYYKIPIIEISNFTGHSLNTIYSVSSYKRAINPYLLTRLMLLYKPLATKVSLDKLPYAMQYEAQEKKDILNLKDTLKKTTRNLEHAQKRLSKLKTIRKDCLRGLHACIVTLKNPELSAQDKSWFISKKKDLLSLLTKNNHSQIYLLENKILGYKTQINHLEQHINQDA